MQTYRSVDGLGLSGLFRIARRRLVIGHPELFAEPAPEIRQLAPLAAERPPLRGLRKTTAVRTQGLGPRQIPIIVSSQKLGARSEELVRTALKAGRRP